MNFDLWHSVTGLLGLGGLTIIVLAAIAWFFPPLRRIAIEIGMAILAVGSIYAKGASDEKRKRELLEKQAADNAVAAGNRARSDAARDAGSGVSDGYQRD